MLAISVDKNVLANSKLDWGIACASILTVQVTACIGAQVFTDQHPKTVQRRADKAATRAREGLPVAPRASLPIFILRGTAPGFLVVVIIEVYTVGVRAVYHALDYTAWRVGVYAISFLVCKVRFLLPVSCCFWWSDKVLTGWRREAD